MCFCLRRCSRSIFRRSARRRRRRLRARVAHLPVFRCSSCRWCPVRAESEASEGEYCRSGCLLVLLFAPHPFPSPGKYVV